MRNYMPNCYHIFFYVQIKQMYIEEKQQTPLMVTEFNFLTLQLSFANVRFVLIVTWHTGQDN